MRPLGLAAAAIAACNLALAAAPTADSQVVLLRGSASVEKLRSLDACIARARELAKGDSQTPGTVIYKCQTGKRQVIAAYVSNPPAAAADTIRHGTTFVLRGTGFGAKPQAQPVMFDDFEKGSGNVEGQKGVIGSWGRGDWSRGVTYDTTQPLEGAKVARHSFGSGNYNASLYVDRTSTVVYADFWMRVVPRKNFTRNFKAWRFYGANDSSVANEVVMCDSPGWAGMETGGGAWVQRARTTGQWEHYRIVMKSGAGGVFSQHRDGIADVDNPVQGAGTALGIRIGHYWALDGDENCKPNPGADVYTDLVYIDTSLARVYLADADELGKARHTAIQIPLEWSDTEVSVAANTQGFKPGATAYVLLIDAANRQRAAMKVTVRG